MRRCSKTLVFAFVLNTLNFSCWYKEVTILTAGAIEYGGDNPPPLLQHTHAQTPTHKHMHRNTCALCAQAHTQARMQACMLGHMDAHTNTSI